MGALPHAATAALPRSRELPDYLPARMVNEFVYCPRLFFYEWVDGVFRESVDTIEGSIQHARVDSGKGELPRAGEQDEKIHARSVTLSSERLRVIAKLDLIDAEGSNAIPVDYKHGRPRETDGVIELWAPDKIQIALQALILRDNGYACNQGVVFYQRTRQRVRLAVIESLEQEAIAAVQAAWECARRTELPAPLVDSPKCTGCSLNGICLPDETNCLGVDEPEQLSLFDPAAPGTRKPPASVRRLIAARDDLKPAYLNTQGLRVGKSGSVLQVKDKDTLLQEIRLGEICQLNLMGNIQLSTQAIQALCEAEIPICYFSIGGWFYGMTHGLNQKNVFLRQRQFRMADTEWFPLTLSRSLVAAKARNQRVMLSATISSPRREIWPR